MGKTKKNSNLFANYDGFTNEISPEITKISFKKDKNDDINVEEKINQNLIEKLQINKTSKQKGPKTFYISNNTFKKLQLLAKATNRSMSEIIEIAIEELLTKDSNHKNTL